MYFWHGVNNTSRDGGRDGTSASTSASSSRGLISASENQNAKMVIRHAHDPNKARVTSVAIISVATLAKGRANTSSKLAANNTMMSGSMNGSFVDRSGTLTRQMTFSTLRRTKEKKPYKFICRHLFSAFRSMEVIKSCGIFILKLRDEKADELCAFQLTNGCGVEVGVEFFHNLIKKNLRDTTRELFLEELTVENLEYQYANRPEECETIKKALSIATEFHTTGSIRRPSQLRRAVSNVSLGFSSGLQRFTSKSRMPNIGEMHEKSIRFH